MTNKIYALFAFILFLNYNLTWAQDKKDNDGKCFTPTTFNDETYNKKVAQLLKDTKPDDFKNMQYAGHHSIDPTYYYVKNAFDEVTARCRLIEVSYKLGDGSCTIEAYVIVEENLGGGNFTDPQIYKHYKDLMPAGPYGMFEKRKTSCACQEKSPNWLEGGTAASNSSSTSENNSSSTNSSNSNSGKADGPYEEKWSNGTIKIKGEYKNGMKNGRFLEFNTKGNIEKEENYANDKLNGKSVYYNDDGVKYEEVNFKDDKKDGERTTYETTDKSINEVETYANDTKNGPYKHYYNGKLDQEGSYANGIKDGTWKEYDGTGKVTKTTIYKDGVPQ